MTLRRSLRPLLALAISVSLVAGFGATAEGVTVARVRASGTRFRPKLLSVSRGTKVIWKSTLGNHTVTAYGGNWHKDSAIPEGTRTHFTFDTRGTYKYYCKIHGFISGGQCSGMCGKVVVG